MIEPAVVLVRLIQYAAGAVLGGVPLFCLHAAPARWPRAPLIAAAGVLALASLAAIAVQSALFAGSAAAGLTSAALRDVIAFLPLGKVALIRAGLAAAAAAVLVADRRGRRKGVVAALGLAAAASLAWLGHAGAGEHALQLLADIVHVLAAVIWLGALAGLLGLAVRRGAAGELPHALSRFSGIGVAVVAALVASGLANAVYLVGLGALRHPLATPYGVWLAAKLALFAAMLPLAAWHRYRPATAKRATLAAEAMLGLGVLAAVAVLGTLEPPLG